MLEPSLTRRADAVPTLYPITSTELDHDVWEGATWIGEVELEGFAEPEVSLHQGHRFRQARFLVWDNNQPRGFVEVPVHAGSVDLQRLRDQARTLPTVASRALDAPQPPISVVICTRDRPHYLATMLGSLHRLDYPHFEVIVVDNHPTSGLTPPVLEQFSDLRIRLVDAAGQGLSIARNVGIRNARYDVVAFTDDDVVLDKRWLANIARGFARDDRVACVCGMVPTSEALTPAQAYFDHRVSWAERWAPALYSLENQLGDGGLFPLQVSQFGTGANFAVRKDVVTELGGFDEALGAGSPAGSGEDIDIFVRVLLAGHLLAREPSAIVWHSHRQTAGELAEQLYNYGVGLTAWITTLLLHPRTCALVLRRGLLAVRHFRKVIVVEHDAALDAEPALTEVNRRELAGVLHGPWALLRGRLAGRKRAPLKMSSSRLSRIFDIRRGRMWGETGYYAVLAQRATMAVVAGTGGALGAVEFLPSSVRAIAVTAFILVGPGALAGSFYPRVPRTALAVLIPVSGLAMCLLVVTVLLMVGVYDPPLVLLGLTLTTVVGALVRRAHLASPRRLTA